LSVDYRQMSAVQSTCIPTIYCVCKKEITLIKKNRVQVG